MKIYLSSAYARREEMRGIAAKIDARGHEVVSRWLLGPAAEEDKTRTLKRRAWAMEDIADVLRCDLFVAFADSMREYYPGGMRHVEFGVAWISEKQCWLVGEPDHIGHDLPGVRRFESTADVLAALEGMK